MSDRDPPHVLIVDDEPMVLTATRIVLRSAGFRVSTAENGAAGVEAALRDVPDVILLDVMMPDIDGWETLGRLREHKALERVPVLIFTAREHTRGWKLARDLGAAGYVRKPFDADELIALMHRHAVRGTATEESLESTTSTQAEDRRS
jgi:DNA-binding response OmpR family regulator